MVEGMLSTSRHSATHRVSRKLTVNGTYIHTTCTTSSHLYLRFPSLFRFWVAPQPQFALWTLGAPVPDKRIPFPQQHLFPMQSMSQHTTAQVSPGCPPGHEKSFTCCVWAPPALQVLSQAVCKHGSAFTSHELHTTKSLWARVPSYTARIWAVDEHPDLCSCIFQHRMERPRGQLSCQVPNDSDFKQCPLAYLLWQAEDTWGTPIHQQWHNGSPLTSIQFESCMWLGSPEISYSSDRKKKFPRASSVFFVVATHSPLCAHPCSRWKMLLRAPAGTPPTTA